MDRLKPCPMCGGKAEIGIVPVEDGRGFIYGVQCSVYECNARYIILGETREEAIEAWNAHKVWDEETGKYKGVYNDKS